MNIKIKANHGLELTDAIKSYAEGKVFEAVKKFDGVLGVDVELDKTNSSHHSGENYEASAKIIVSGKDLFVKEVKTDLYVAIDALKDKIEYELSSRKDKSNSLLKKMGHKMKNMLKSN